MGVPSIEKCPSGLDPKWSATWRLTRDELKEAGTFSASMRPLLDEFVFALKAAEEARIGFRWLDSLEQYAEASDPDDLPEIAWTVLRQIATGLPVVWDKHAKRASALADQLGLSPKAQRALGRKLEGGKDGEQDTNPFSGLDDEVSAKRKAKVG
jgi:hypothetical protein